MKKAEQEKPKPVEIGFHCVVCGERIDNKRIIRKAVTCSDEHANLLKNARRRVRAASVCQMCRRPVTPEEMASYRTWRKTLPGLHGGRPKGSKNKPKPAEAEAAPAPVELEGSR